MATEKEIQYLKLNFKFKGLVEMGFYDKGVKQTDYDYQIKRICEFFNISNIFLYDIIMLEKNKYVKPELKTFSQN
jgi:hypothetical protein